MSLRSTAAPLFGHALAQGLRGKRLVGLVLLALLPGAIGLLLHLLGAAEGNDPAGSGPPLLALNLVVPLIALFLGINVMREELDNDTLVHLTTRPVDRRTILTVRLLAAATGAGLLTMLSMGLAVLTSQGAPPGDLVPYALIGLAGAVVYTCLFALLGTLTQRGVLVGLVYIVAWENVVASTPLVFNAATVARWLRSLVVEADLVPVQEARALVPGGAAEPTTALLALGLIALVATVAAAGWFQRMELTGPEPE